MSPLRVMTFNLRYPARDGQPWSARLPVARDLLRTAAPHMVGTQEGHLHQLEELVAGLPERYAWLGTGREGGDAGEFTAILYDQERVRVDRWEVRWFSDRPTVPGTRGPGAAHPRTVTWIDATDRVTGQRLRMLDCHLDHRSQPARLAAAEALATYTSDARENGRAVVLLGDFNVSQDDEVHARLTGGGDSAGREDATGLSDVVDTLRAGAPGSDPCPDARIDTFHHYRGVKRTGKRIDWILHSPDLVPLDYRVDTHGRGFQYPSDHFPVLADLVPAGS
ncbi:endonuclease/exonuclease/phosphatase family protein [Brevibacterium litoralis]|uniref:endonuclease/exonuclease/phosphatase family protein n=1 Tax=Brevibacterium litoralis TaxID=3138935 RepID=UPI0032ED7D63